MRRVVGDNPGTRPVDRCDRVPHPSSCRRRRGSTRYPVLKGAEVREQQLGNEDQLAEAEDDDAVELERLRCTN